MALSLTVIPSVLWAQKPATEHTIRANEAVKTELNFDDRQDYEDANRGFIASIDGNAVLDKEGKVSYSVEEWDFLKGNTPQTVNPSLWRQSQLNRINGLFEVIPDKLYQVRGFDIANMTFIRSDNGWIIIDVTTTNAAAKAGYDLIKKHVADLPVQGVIFTHPHGDHYGGIAAVKEASSKKNFDIIAPKGFMASAQNENVLAGVTMIRRAAYMYGLRLQPGEKGTLGCGLGQRMSTGSKGIAQSYYRNSKHRRETYYRRRGDGVCLCARYGSSSGNHGLASATESFLYGRRHDAQYAQPANAAWSESAQRTTVEQGGGYSHRTLRRPGGSVILNPSLAHLG